MNPRQTQGSSGKSRAISEKTAQSILDVRGATDITYVTRELSDRLGEAKNALQSGEGSEDTENPEAMQRTYDDHTAMFYTFSALFEDMRKALGEAQASALNEWVFGTDAWSTDQKESGGSLAVRLSGEEAEELRSYLEFHVTKRTTTHIKLSPASQEGTGRDPSMVTVWESIPGWTDDKGGLWNGPTGETLSRMFCKKISPLHAALLDAIDQHRVKLVEYEATLQSVADRLKGGAPK